MRDILYTSDSNFYTQLYISIVSICEHVKNNVVFHIVEKGFSDEQIEKLRDLTNNYGHRIEFYDSPRLPNNLVVTGNRSEAAFYRICGASILPNTVNKVLYLDSDTIIEQDISHLFKLDMDNYYLAGVQDIVDVDDIVAIKLDQDTAYINSGMLIMNLNEWRDKGIEMQLVEYISKYSSSLKNNDQDALNYICRNKIKIIPLKYNVTTPYFEYTCKEIEKMRRIKLQYSEQDRIHAINCPYIIHYSGSRFDRPWNVECDHPKKERYFFYANKAGLTVKLLNGKITIKEKLVRWGHHNIPKCVFIVLKRIRHK